MTDKVTQLVPRYGEILEDQEVQPDDARYWSVTTILGCIAKNALVPWAAKATAVEAVARSHIWTPMAEGEAIKWLSAARFRPPPDAELEADTLGTNVHTIAQHMALWGKRPDIVHPECVPFLDQFDRWLNRFQPEYEAAEVVVYHPDYGYAGTADAIFTIPAQADADRCRILVDYKTSREPLDSRGNPKRPYPETVLQLAAYRYAKLAAVWRARRYSYYKRRYYLLSPGELALAVPMPEVDAAGCMLITPESCDLFPMRANQDAFRFFLHTIEVARWVLQQSRDSVGDPIDPEPLFPDWDGEE